MIERFTRPGGDLTLRAAVLEQRIVAHDTVVADRLIAAGTLGEHAAGAVLIEQGSGDDTVYLVLVGAVNVEINGRVVASRGPNDTIGEMSAIDPSATRSASVRATVASVTLSIPASAVIAIADTHPLVWRSLARISAERLRERARFHRAPNSRPVVFVGSSVEGLEIAKHIQMGLKHDPAEIRIWTNGVFGPSGVTIDKLSAQIAECDFSVFVFGPDDQVASREETRRAPRDNVILELGMFLSAHGRERTMMVMEHGADLKIPTDLLGITPVTYVASKGERLEVVLGPVCTELSKRIRELGAL